MNQDALREHVFLWCFLGGQRNIKEWSRPTYKAYMVPHRNYNEGFPSQVVYLPRFTDETSGLENFIFMRVSQDRKVDKFFLSMLGICYTTFNAWEAVRILCNVAPYLYIDNLMS